VDYMTIGWRWLRVSFPFDESSASKKELDGVYSWQMHYLSPVVL